MLSTIVLIILLILFLHRALATISPLQHIFTNPELTSTAYRIPTIHESAIQARRILKLSSIATISTIFPGTSNASYLDSENRPDGVAGSPVGLIDYYASCDPNLYNPTFLAISVATSFRNARAGSNVTLSLRYQPPPDHGPSKDLYTYSPANLPRFSLIGYIEPLSQNEVWEHKIRSCFFESHPDAEAWTPGNNIHDSWWARLVVQEVYWIGGFGDRAYIGWIPTDIYQAVTKEEVDAARLVGEKGWLENNPKRMANTVK